jgi:hypothetical protein
MLLRNNYRERFKLSSLEMDNEPLSEFTINNKIWGFEEKKKRLEQKRSEQAN